MMIKINDEKKTFKLDTKNSSYVFYVSKEGYLLHTYYGKKIDDDAISQFIPIYTSSNFSPKIPEGRFSLDTIPAEYSCGGIGDLRQTAFSVRGKNGNSATSLKYVSYNSYNGKKKIDGLPASYDNGGECETLEILMRDEFLGIDVLLSYSVFEKYDALAKHIEVRNTSDSPVELERILSGCYDFTESDFDFIHLYGSWAAERQIERYPIHHGIQQISSKRGSSSHHHSPFVALAKHDTTEDFGDAFGFTFVYSGNFVMSAEVDCFGTTRFLCGINPEDFAWHLMPSESFSAPEVISVFSPNGLGEMSRRFHKLIQNNICRGPYKKTRRPVIINNWEGTEMSFDSDKLLAIAKEGTKLDLEMFVMDDGWFGKRDDSKTSIGDWFVYEEKFKNGLPEMVKEINNMGMKFGIWFEPEMVSPVSELYKNHPDYVLCVDGREISIARHQYVLDMTRKDVRDNIFNQMSAILKSCNIEYIKWDFNRNLAEIGSKLLPEERQKEIYHRYVLGLYDLLERLIEEFPNLLIEGCSGGGGRFDAGMLYYEPQIWTSDNTDAVERCFIQYGTSMVFPSSAISAHVSCVPNQQTNRVSPFKTRSDVALSGTYGYELDLTQMSDEDKILAKKYTADYKKYYNLINFGDYYRLISPFENQKYCAWEYLASEKNEALITYVVIRSDRLTKHRVHPKGLEKEAVYNIEIDDKFWGSYCGSTIMNVGIPISNNNDATSTLIHLIRI